MSKLKPGGCICIGNRLESLTVLSQSSRRLPWAYLLRFALINPVPKYSISNRRVTTLRSGLVQPCVTQTRGYTKMFSFSTQAADCNYFNSVWLQYHDRLSLPAALSLVKTQLPFKTTIFQYHGSTQNFPFQII